MARLMVKVSSLTKVEQAAFKKSQEGRYVLAKVLQKYDWDSGSVWSLIKDPTSGELVLARDEEKFKKTAGLNVLSTKLVCDTCRRDLDEIIIKGNLFKLCTRCDESTIASMQETAILDQGIIGDPSAGTGINIAAVSEPLPFRLVGHIQRWVEAGMKDFSDHALTIAIETSHKARQISTAEAHIMGSALHIVRDTATATYDAINLEANVGNPFADGEMAQDMRGHVDLADRAMADLAAITPRGMGTPLAAKIREALRVEAGRMIKEAKSSPEASEWISKKIPKLMEEGMEQDQAIAAAHNMARDKGFRSVPDKKSSLVVHIGGDFATVTPNEDRLEVKPINKMGPERHEEVEVLLFDDLGDAMNEGAEITDLLKDMHEDVTPKKEMIDADGLDDEEEIF